jgi:hypothetical protein
MLLSPIPFLLHDTCNEPIDTQFTKTNTNKRKGRKKERKRSDGDGDDEQEECSLTHSISTITTISTR